MGITNNGDIYYIAGDNKPYYAEPQWRPLKDPVNTALSVPDLLLSQTGPALPAAGALAASSLGPGGEAVGAATGNHVRQWGAEIFIGQDRSMSDMLTDDLLAAGQQVAGKALVPIWPERGKIASFAGGKLGSLVPHWAPKIAPIAGRASDFLRDSLASWGLDRFVANARDPYAAGNWSGLPHSVVHDAISNTLLYGNPLGGE